MKRLFILIIALELFAGQSVYAARQKRKPDHKRKFAASATARDKFSVTCRSYRADLAVTAGCKGRACDKFKDRAMAIKVLEKLLQHPPTPKAIQDSHRTFVSNEPVLMKSDWITDYAPLSNEYCALITVNALTKRLIDERAAYTLNDDELRHLREHVLNMARTELSYPTGILTTRLALGLLQDLAHAELIPGGSGPFDSLASELEGVRVELKDSELAVLRGDRGGLRLLFNEFKRVTPVREKILAAANGF